VRRVGAEQIHERIERASSGLPQELFDADVNLRAELGERYDFSRIVGNSGSMRQVYEQIAQVACADTTVLISGETGTGKELVAHALHINSPRKEKPLIKVNCSALPESLIEAELFGYERGAFTGATAPKPGRFELAEGGSLFLDEVGELSFNIQTKLLRVLQEREYERLGSSETIKADLRLIVATNRELGEEVSAGRFRSDLYYRLNVFPITTPALRQRKEDLPLLAGHILKKHTVDSGRDLKEISPEAMKLLAAYDWPGNVRELENVLERAVVVSEGPVITPQHLPPSLHPEPEETINAFPSDQRTEIDLEHDAPSLLESVEEFEKGLICKALQATAGNRNQAAKRLKISERLLSYKVKKHAIDCALFRNASGKS
jgi:Nif-specific regulatory protein